MKGDFTRFTHATDKQYTRVLKQQGRVDLDADWNEAIEIFTHRDRTEAIDVIGRCGVPVHDAGFSIEPAAGGSDLTIGPGRLYVDGILCEMDEPVSITEQDDLPGYEPPVEDGVYLAYVDVWDRHITSLEDPEIREVALGGPDTTTRTQTIHQVRLHRIGDDSSLEGYECEPYPAAVSTGRLAARAATAVSPSNPCAVPEGAGYTGLENRLYRVEIHDDGRDEAGNVVRPVTFKWSRDNGSVVLPIADDNGIDGDTVTVGRFGFDDVLTVKTGDWVEVLGEETELSGRPGTIAQVIAVDKDDLEIQLDRDVSIHAGERRLKVRRWDHHETEDAALIDGALPLPAGDFELEDGVIIEFEAGGEYRVGDYWMIPARTREGDVLWPSDGTPPVARTLTAFGIHHHYCTLALVRRSGGTWTEVRDCRPHFPPLTEVEGGCCCVSVEPGGDIQQAIDTVVTAGGGCVTLCEGVHVVNGPLHIRDCMDVTLRGENGASFVRFDGLNDEGDGGLVVTNARRVALEDLFIASETVPALVTVRHGEELGLNREIALRRLLLLNLRPSNPESDFSCGVRLGHTQGVTIDECSIAADVGIVSLWGNALPEFTAPGVGLPALLRLGFEALDEGSEIRVGDSFTEAGVKVTGTPFVYSFGESYEGGSAIVGTRGFAGGSGKELQLANITLAFDLPAAYTTARIPLSWQGGDVNLSVNGELRSVPEIDDLDGETIGGVRVRVSSDPETRRGMLTLSAVEQPIGELAIGGQEFWIDDVQFRGPDQEQEVRLEYGDGVRALRMRDSAVRFDDFGMLAARAADWQLDCVEILPFDESVWGRLQESFSEGDREDGEAPATTGTLASYQNVRALFGELFAGSGSLRGAALLAFRWEGSFVRDSHLSGVHGAHAWWWLRGNVLGSRIRAEESGCHAFWLYGSDWSGNDVEATDGIAFSAAGFCRARMEHNRLNGLVGVANLPFIDALDGLETLALALLRGYGTIEAADVAAIYGILVDESLRLMGFGEVLDAYQRVVEEQGIPQDIPISYLFAVELLNSVRALADSGALQAVPLPLINVQITHSEISCRQQGISFDGYLPLGSLRIAENQIHTTEGQAVRVETNPYLANAHLIAFLIRHFVYQLSGNLSSLFKQVDDGPLTDCIQSLERLFGRWQAGVENLLDLDFRIEANTIRSFRTAIESNLFELAVLTNHITVQERQVRSARRDANGVIFGRVHTVEGAPISQASIRLLDTDHVVFSNEKGTYQMVGVPAGSHALRASHAGYAVDQATVSLREGERAEINFTLRPLHSKATHVIRRGFGDRVVGERTIPHDIETSEIAEVVEALETSAALEPLAVALREGAHTIPEIYAGYLLAEKGPLSSADERDAAADAAAVIRGEASDPEMRHAAEEFGEAVRVNDRTRLNSATIRFVAALYGYVDSQGILLKGVGCRIVENEVIVPVDRLSDSAALGGIQISVNYVYVTVLSMLGTIVARYMGGDTDADEPLDPLLGITETLIDTNEIVGGAGHGISLQGFAGRPDFLTDLRITGNQIRGMGGAGLFINEYAIVVGLEVSDNAVTDCGRAAGFSAQKGGIVVRTAAVCHLRGNQVTRCGEDARTSGIYGVDLDTVYGLRFIGNAIQANGSAKATPLDGGLRLAEVYGATMLHDNLLAFNRGMGLSWINSAREDEPALIPMFLLQAVNHYLDTNRTIDLLANEEQASVQSNVLKSTADTDLPVFQLMNLRDVLLSGNTCYAEMASSPLGEVQMTTRGVVSHNQMQASGEVAIAIKKMAAGVVLGNVGNRPIQLQGSLAVQHAYNVPPVI